MAKSRTTWQKGRSGNPRGRPAVCFELQAAAREHGPRCVAILAQLAGIEGPGAANEAVRLGAARELLDRGFGKATTVLAGDDATGPVEIVFKWQDSPLATEFALPLIEAQAADAEAAADAVTIWGSSC